MSSTPENRPLADLAECINDYHRQAEIAFMTGLESAINAGNLLIEAKAQCPHGEWLPWLETNFEGSTRTAQSYMRVAMHYSLADLKNATGVAHLSYRDALRALAEPRPERRSVTEERNPYREWLEVADALVEIRDRERYRDGYESFVEYYGEHVNSNLDWIGMIDDPVHRNRASLLADLHDIIPGIRFSATGLEIPEDVDLTYEQWHRGLRILEALAGATLGATEPRRREAGRR